MKLHMKKSGDVLIFSPVQWLFNLFKPYSEKEPCYFSVTYNIRTSSLADYWAELGKKDALLEVLKSKRNGVCGRTLESLILQVAVAEYGKGVVFVIYNYDLSQLKRIIERLPNIDPSVFQQDVIYIPCNSIRQAQKLKSVVPSSMSSTMIVDHGVGIVNNIG